MATHTLSSLFADIADQIRSKTSTTAKIRADDFPDAIHNIEPGGSVFGINMTNMFINDNGTLRKRVAAEKLDTLVISADNIGYGALQYFFARMQVDKVIFSEMEQLTGGYALEHAFQGSSMKEVRFEKLRVVNRDESEIGSTYAQIHTCFKDCTQLSSVYFGELREIYGQQESTFQNTPKLLQLEFPNLSVINSCHTFLKNSNVLSVIFNDKFENEITSSSGFASLWGRGAGNAEVIFKNYETGE